MGIPFYVASLLRTHKHIQKNCTRVDTDIFALDFNCFIHKYLKSENPVGSIVVALEELMTSMVRAKRVYLAFDGLVPYAKMVQQRYRRMRRQEPADFDKHQISPGTPFMRDLADTLKFLYPNIVISDTLEPGEGEHKMFRWFRTIPENERKTICIYGLDADLVLISIAQSHLGDIQLLREKEDDTFATISVSAIKEVLPVDPDTYVKMCVMCFGNDFMPAVGMFSLREEGYARAIYYSDKHTAGKDEKKILMKRAKNSDRHIVAPDGHALEARYSVHVMDGVLDWEPVVYAFWKTCEWTYHYFTTSEVLDWRWYYPYPEAPLVETLDAYDRPMTFSWDHPEPDYDIKDQLQFILPSHSLKGLPQKYPDELYDEQTETRHPWMKRFAWECDPWVSLPWELTTVSEYVLPQL
jgi:5'-3' exonuclease